MLMNSTFPADQVTEPGELLSHTFVQGHHSIESVRNFAGCAFPIQGETHRKVAALERVQRDKQCLGVNSCLPELSDFVRGGLVGNDDIIKCIRHLPGRPVPVQGKSYRKIPRSQLAERIQ